MKILGWLIAASVVSLVAYQGSASAHVLIKSDDDSVGGVFHINPDDDPIAGKRATLYLDVEGKTVRGSSLTVTKNDSNYRVDIETSIDDSLVAANYTFPTQGTYRVSYTITSSRDERKSFTQLVRVSRGVRGGQQETQRHVWAEILFVVSAVGMMIVLILAYNHRYDIDKHSKLSS